MDIHIFNKMGHGFIVYFDEREETINEIKNKFGYEIVQEDNQYFILTNYFKIYFDKRPCYLVFNGENNADISCFLTYEDAMYAKGNVNINLKMKKVFISGPMTDYPNHNFEIFDELEKHLNSFNIECINPANTARKYFEHEDFFQKDGSVNKESQSFHDMINEELDALKTCDTIYLLPGWEESFGAKNELKIAIENGLNVIQHSNVVNFILSKNTSLKPLVSINTFK